MAVRIPEDKINEVREASDIVEVVSAYLTLKRRGTNFFGLCPFHTEKTPSFSVNPQRQIFHCFGCGAGGNVFTFLMRIEGITFPEAVLRLAQRAGISIALQTLDEQEARLRESVYAANRLAAEFFYRNLAQAPEGAPARAYLESRHLELQVLGKFGLGYALDRWDALIAHAASKKVSVEALNAAGLVVARDDGGYYDRFRHRLMFPFFDVMGKVVGFGGRRLREDEQAKYMNSPETIVYKKGTTLYGLYQTKDYIRQSETAILVEGYIDLLSLFQRGIRNVVASSGTALTEEQAALLRRYCEQVVVLYDADSAGSSAAVRGADILIAKGLDVRVARLPSGHDPDSFINEHGAEAVATLVGQAQSLVEFKIGSLRQAGFFETPEKKARAIHTVLNSVAVIPDDIKRNLVVQQVAQMLEMDERFLAATVNRLRRGERWEDLKTGAVAGTGPALSRADQAEKLLVSLMVSYPEIIPKVRQYLNADHFRHPGLQAFVAELWAAEDRGQRLDPTGSVAFHADPDLASLVVAATTEEERQPGLSLAEREQLMRDAIAVLRRRPLEEEQRAVRVRIKELQAARQSTTEAVMYYKQLAEELKRIDEWRTRGDATLSGKQQA
ncbi:MAG: DNA primase [candidate division KSB1 bacterium]|nr:DNA primase [candidate division KSB1 bacterium]MDZ7413009.1 DNA primase [candidate division KSB1 bacterium]